MDCFTGAGSSITNHQGWLHIHLNVPLSRVQEVND
jgi:hypothetical protein